MNVAVMTTNVVDGIAVITLGSANRIYFDGEMGDVLTEANHLLFGSNNSSIDPLWNIRPSPGAS